jgi:hypothetical protein
MTCIVEHNFPDLQNRRRHNRVAPQQRTNPGKKFRKRERLHEVIIGAVIEPGYPIIKAVAGGEHQNPWLRVERRPSNRATNFSAILTRHGDVQTHEVVSVDQSLRERFGAIIRDIHRVSLSTQPAGHSLGQLDFVIDNQNSHWGERYRSTPPEG